MQVPPLIQEFLKWRWSPCVALTAGSLAFVVLAVILIPSQMDGEPPASQALSAFDRPGVPPKPMLNASLAQGAVLAERVSVQESSARPRAQPAQPVPPQQRGFSPILERAEPAPPPPETPPAPPPQAAAPQAVAPVLPPGAQEAAPPPPDSDAPRREN